MILVDAFSKWAEITLMSNTAASDVVKVLNGIFAKYGPPAMMVSDNGPPIASSEFSSFCNESGIKLIHSPPYHPQSNGLAERWVQTVKGVIKKNFLNESYSNEKLDKILFLLRNTPSCDVISAHVFLGFKPRTSLERILPRNEVVAESSSEIPSYRKFELGEFGSWG